jgi:hypothetical protein
VELISTAKYYVGVCPVKVKMTGKITVRRAMTLKYYFVRSDGVKTRLAPLIFRRGGTKNVPFSWSVGKDYYGWVQLIVNHNGRLIKSAKKDFQVKCDKKPVLTPVKKIDPTKIRVKKPELVFIQKNTTMVINKLNKHLPPTLNTCTLAKWTMKAPKPPEDPANNVLSSIWETTYDGMRVKITSSVSPGYEGMIISGIKLTIPVRTGYNRKTVSDWILRKYGTNTRVGSTQYSIEYMTNCWWFFKLRSKEVTVELKWNG